MIDNILNNSLNIELDKYDKQQDIMERTAVYRERLRVAKIELDECTDEERISILEEYIDELEYFIDKEESFTTVWKR